MKALIKKHRKKSIAGAFSLATVLTVMELWGRIYPVVCPLVASKEVCEASGKVAIAVAATLDETRLDVELDGGLSE